jgi:hypothetical protein
MDDLKPGDYALLYQWQDICDSNWDPEKHAVPKIVKIDRASVTGSCFFVTLISEGHHLVAVSCLRLKQCSQEQAIQGILAEIEYG